MDRFDVTLVDMAGGQQLRGTWQNYYAEAHGIVFVVDSSDTARLATVRWNLASVLRHPRISGKPLLLLANKQDKVNTLLPSELIEPLSLEKLVNENKSLCCIEPCSAVGGFHKAEHWDLLKALRWLLCTIANNYNVLVARVQYDSNLQGPGAHKHPENADKTCSHTHRDRDLQTSKAQSQEGEAELLESKPVSAVKLRSLLPIHRLRSQVSDMEGLKSIKKLKRKPNIERKDAANLESMVEVEKKRGRKQRFVQKSNAGSETEAATEEAAI
uniref:ADP-ribosylation factor-like protein 13A n=1 Tax=Geotrypetes seraphini TaxID=260995 RepID=A0A6P8QRS2_GEOSA|nr:ADP-ribosylation factor-like protein 13A [Geotrypetes seraphini]